MQQIHTKGMKKNKGKNSNSNEFSQEDAVQMAWELFNQSGSVAHYLLYKRLKDKE